MDTPLAKLYIIHLAQTYPLPVWSSLGLLVALTLLSWLGGREKQIAIVHPLSEQDRIHMLRRLRVRYEQIRAQSLQGVIQLELGLASRPAAVQNAVSLSLRLPDQPEHPLPPHTSIVQAYELAQHELLILGEPGAGKSTLLLELARSLVEQAEQDATQPLPILLPLSSWAEHKSALDEWLIQEVARLYDVPRRLSQQWVGAEQMLPLLDGLDEMEETARPTCIAAINAYHHEHLRPLVVCSRTGEYDAATKYERLALHTAVMVQPLVLDQVDTYLASLGKPLAGLQAALKTNAILQELATTPLMLQVLMLTYHGTSVRTLSQQEASLREQIWGDYVQRMVSRKGDTKCYPLSITVTWLSELARQMRAHNQTIFILKRLQSDWLPQKQKVFYRWSVRLLFGLVCGVLFGLIGGLLVGLVCGVLFGLIRELYEVRAFRRQLDEDAHKLVGWLVTWLLWGVAGLLFALVGSLAAGGVGWLLFGLVAGLLFALVGGLFFTMLAVIVIGFGLRGEPREDHEPVMVFAMTGGLIVGLIVGLIIELTTAALLFDEGRQERRMCSSI